MTSYTIGIDLGTTNCCVAYVGNDNLPQVVVRDFDQRTFRSVISIEQDGNDTVWKVGEPNVRHGCSGEHVFYNVKRVIGRDWADGQLQTDISKWKLPCERIDNRLYCKLGKNAVLPAELSALLLMQAKKAFQDATGHEVKNCVLTVPAYFTEAQRRATRDAARIANLDVAKIVNEPTAIAVAHLWSSGKQGRYLVIDVGGGTTDCSRISVNGPSLFHVEAISGDNALGGEDFLDILVDLFRKKAEDVGLTIPLHELRDASEGAKRINDGPFRIFARGTMLSIPREEYEKAMPPLLKKIKKIIDQACGNKDELDGIILAGGALCQRDIRDFVTNLFENVPILPQSRPAEMVAEGAAIIASNISSIIITEVLPRALGIDTQVEEKESYDLMEVILQKNCRLPASSQMDFIAVNNEGTTEICLYEGDNKASSKNILLGTATISARKKEEITVKVEASADGMIELSASTTNGDEPTKIEVRRTHFELSDSEVATLREAASQRFAPVQKKQRVSKRKRKYK